MYGNRVPVVGSVNLGNVLEAGFSNIEQNNKMYKVVDPALILVQIYFK